MKRKRPSPIVEEYWGVCILVLNHGLGRDETNHTQKKRMQFFLFTSGDTYSAVPQKVLHLFLLRSSLLGGTVVVCALQKSVSFFVCFSLGQSYEMEGKRTLKGRHEQLEKEERDTLKRISRS